jgi:type VI secretion system protein ImpH
LSLEDYGRFLPTGDRIGRLVTLVRNYAGDELAWDVCLVLKADEVPSARLEGGYRLGWNTWIGKRTGSIDASDLVLDAFGWVSRPPTKSLSRLATSL